MEKLKVAQISLSMGTGGLEHCILNLINHLDPERFDTTVGCLDYAGELFPRIAAAGHTSFCETRRPGLDWRLIFRLKNYFAKTGVHIVHTHNQAAHFYAGIAAFLARVPVRITTEHSRHHIAVETRRIWEKQVLCTLTDQWVTVNQPLYEASREDGLPLKKLHVIQNGIPVPDACPEPQPHSKLAAQLGLSPEDQVVLMAARLDSVKNHELMFQALAREKSNLTRVRLLIAGDGERREYLERLAQELGIADQVIFLGNRDDVGELLALARVFVLCSHTEGLSLALLEAAASGTPILISRPANTAAFVTPDETGVESAPSAREMGRCLKQMLADPQALRPMAEQAFQRVKARYSARAMAENYADLYLDLARKKGVCQ